MKHILGVTLLFLCACTQDPAVPEPKQLKTKFVFVVMMDGARYSETWGAPNQMHIPNMKSLAARGVVCTNFYNDGQTVTVPGHTAVTTGNYQLINNGGAEIPELPSMLQYYLSQNSKPLEDAWVIASKDKLEVLSDCLDPAWAGKFNPRTDCGISGLFTGYREDSITFVHIKDTLNRYHPHLVLINFREPDVAGHTNNWNEYIKQTVKVDQYIGDFWNYLQNDPIFVGQSTLIVTNDHGRHLDSVADGFASHGDNCEGCKHLLMFGIGPDFKTNHIEKTYYSLIDISATICKLLGFNMPTGKGKVMEGILED